MLPPWLGGLALAALFAAEISTADAVLFMLSTSLSQDLYKSFVNPGADDRRLLRVSRLTSVAAGLLGVVLAILLPTVVDALKTFYGILTATLFVPLIGGLWSSKATASHARLAVGLSLLVTVAGRAALSGSRHCESSCASRASWTRPPASSWVNLSAATSRMARRRHARCWPTC